MWRSIKAFFMALRWPRDAHFAMRKRVAWCDFYLVELGATEHTLLLDSLHAIRMADTDIQTKSSQVLGLRLQALAYSIRTRRGRIPFDANKREHLQILAFYPVRVTAEAVSIVAELSDMPWLSPMSSDDELAESDSSDDGCRTPEVPPINP